MPRINPGDVDLHMQFIIRNDKGKVRYKKTMQCHSFVDNFLKLIYLCMSKNNVSLQNTANGTENYVSAYNVGSYYLECDAASTNTNYGVIVGTGTTAPTISDYSVETKIAHGTSSGQLQYSATSVGAPTTDATTSTLVVTRLFTNASGGSIDINECGLVVRSNDDYVLIIRDIISPAITVADAEELTLNYKIKATV